MHVAKKSVVFLMKQVERQYHFLFSKYNFVIAAEREENAKRERGVGEKQFGIEEIRICVFPLQSEEAGRWSWCTNSPPSHLDL